MPTPDGPSIEQDPDLVVGVLADVPALDRLLDARHVSLSAIREFVGRHDDAADVVRHYSEKGSADVPALRLTKVEQTDLVVFLASARASYLSGTVITQDGGQSLRARAT